MKKCNRDPIREDRIHGEAIADADPGEQAVSWYYYGKQNQFPVPGNVYHRETRLAS
jgi:hypothetical protein